MVWPISDGIPVGRSRLVQDAPSLFEHKEAPDAGRTNAISIPSSKQFQNVALQERVHNVWALAQHARGTDLESGGLNFDVTRKRSR